MQLELAEKKFEEDKISIQSETQKIDKEHIILKDLIYKARDFSTTFPEQRVVESRENTASQNEPSIHQEESYAH